MDNEREASWHIPQGWKPAMAKMVASPGSCVVLGGPDSGKSTFCLALANLGVANGCRVAVVDADVGQSDIGPPTTTGVGFLEGEVQRLEEIQPAAIRFVGATSPGGHLLQTAVAAYQMVDFARSQGAQLIITDTSGMVMGSAARALKAYKIELIKPEFVVGLAEEDELEHLLAPYRTSARPMVFRLKPSPQVVAKSREERRKRRERKFASYFRKARNVAIPWRQMALRNTIWLSGKPLAGHFRQHLEDSLECQVLQAEQTAEGLFAIVDRAYNERALASLEPTFGEIKLTQRDCFDHLLVGLADGQGKTLGLGILSGIDFEGESLSIITPAEKVETVKVVQVGSLRVTPQGEELGSNRPGETG